MSFPQSPPAANVKDTGKSLTLSYAVGKASGMKYFLHLFEGLSPVSGNIQTAQIQLGNYTVDDQAFR